MGALCWMQVLAAGRLVKILGVDSPFFQPSFFSQTGCFPWVFDGFLKRNIPGKNGEGTPRETCIPPNTRSQQSAPEGLSTHSMRSSAEEYFQFYSDVLIGEGSSIEKTMTTEASALSEFSPGQSRVFRV